MATKAAKKTQKAQVAKIVQYEYHGVDKKGKKLKGDISAPSITVAKAELRRQGVITKRIKKKPKPLFGGKQQKITPSDVCIFTRQLATMMKSGVPLVQAFEITAEGLENQSMRKLLLELKTEVEGGNSLENALRRHPKYFDDLFCSLVGAGEQAGALETMLDRVATYQEKSEALKMKIKKAMKYPIAVVCVALIVTVILLVKVVPTFEELFEDLTPEVSNAKRVFTALQTMFPKLPKFPLVFKNLRGKGSGYLETSKLKGGKVIFVDKMIIDDSGLGSFEPDYAVVHEFAHAILAVTKGDLGHNKKHADLTYKLAQKFGLA